MVLTYPAEDDCAFVHEIVNGSLAELHKDDYSAVREIVDSSLANLKDWLDYRLTQQEEDILRRLSNAKEFPSTGTAGSPDRATVKTIPIQVLEPLVADGLSKESSGLKKENTETSRRSWRSTKENIQRMSAASADPEQTKLSSLMGIFDQLDLKKTGCIDISEFNEVSKELEIPSVEASTVFKCMDKSKNGTIDRMEWLHVISESVKNDSTVEMKLLNEFLSQLLALQNERGCIYAVKKTKKNRFIVRHDSLLRVMWDVVMIILLIYIALSVPYELGFGDNKIMDMLEWPTDLFFCCDVVLNFRTTYRDHEDTLVVNGNKIARRYLKSWFVLDFFSSVPFDLITEGLLPNLSPARLLKIGKVAKVLKLLRISKVKAVRAESEFLEWLKLKLLSRNFWRCYRMAKLASIAFLVAHWLACFGNTVDSSAYDAYFLGLDQQPGELQKYLAAMYWAMTTVSTVGYGDITPVSDGERAYAMIAMVIGGSLYGYVVGSVTSIVTDIDVHAHRYHEHMDLMQHWLDRHRELPLLLRRRVRKHFKQALISTTVISDSSVVNKLSPELRGEAAFFLINEQVREHPMFVRHPYAALAELLSVLQETTARANEFIVKYGDPGIGMYILVQGLARYDLGWKWHPPEAEATPHRFQHIRKGESFGEEILFCLEETYMYTVVTVVDSHFSWISEHGFLAHFKHMPELHEQMYEAFLKSHGLGSFSDDLAPASSSSSSSSHNHAELSNDFQDPIKLEEPLKMTEEYSL